MNNNDTSLNEKKDSSQNLNIKSGLTPVSLGELRKPKARNTTLIMVLFFILLFAVLLNLPQIYSYLQNVDINILVPKDNTSSSTILVNNNDQYFEIKSNSKIIINNIVFTSFSKTDTTIEYKVTNNNESSVGITTLNYYLVVYNENKTILDSYEINGGVIAPDSVDDGIVSVSSTISSKIKYIKIVKKSEIDIPEITLNINENGYGVLTCSLNKETYIYYFLNNLVKRVSYTSFIYASESTDYALDTENYENKKSLYATAYPDYVTSVVLNQSSTFLKFTADINLISSTRIELGNDFFFEGNTLAKNINFIVEAKGYDCQ